MSVITIIGGIVASLPDIDLYLRIGGFLIAAVTAVFTGRYYILAARKTKKETELIEKQLKEK